MDHIYLPGINGFDTMDLCWMTLILSSDPTTTSDYTAANGKLAIYRSGDEAWSVTPFPGTPGDTWDIAFYRGLIYIVDANRIFVFDPAAEEKFVRAIPVLCVDGKLSSECYLDGEKVGCGCWNLMSYLVESCGDLLLVRNDMRYSNKIIEVLKLLLWGRMVKMESSGTRRSSLARAALSPPNSQNAKGIIYFGYGGGNKMSVFNFKDGKDEHATSGMECWSYAVWFRLHLL